VAAAAAKAQMQVVAASQVNAAQEQATHMQNAAVQEHVFERQAEQQQAVVQRAGVKGQQRYDPPHSHNRYEVQVGQQHYCAHH
jgi:hypothetical protein